MDLKFTVRGQELSAHIPPTLISDTIGYLGAEFKFSKDWDGLDKWAHLQDESGIVYDVRLVGDRADKLNLTAGYWELWLHGHTVKNGEPVVRITTETVSFQVAQSGALEGEVLPVIELSAAEQIAATAAQAVEIAKKADQSAKTYANAAVQAAQRANASADVSKRNAENASKSASDASAAYADVMRAKHNIDEAVIQFREDAKTALADVDEKVEEATDAIDAKVAEASNSAKAAATSAKAAATSAQEAANWSNALEPRVEALEEQMEDLESGGDLAPRVETLEQQMADLLYEPIALVAKSIDPATVEKGQSVRTATLSWTLNKEPARIRLDGEEIAPAKSGTVTVDVGTQTGWNLTFWDERNKSVNWMPVIAFYNGVYYGAASAPEIIDSAFVLGLEKKVLSNAKGRTITVDAGEGEYIWYCLPARLGGCTFKAGLGEGGFVLVDDDFAFKNGKGYTEPYRIYRSARPGLGETTVEVS